MQSNTYVAIMAGGIGSRFWPGSRESRPKQFLDMLGVGKSLLRLTFERFLRVCPASNIVIVTNEAYRALIHEQIPEIGPDQVLCEPSRNNTAPSIAWTAFHLAARNPEANFVVAPSDHIILKEDVFLEKVSLGLAFASAERALITLGIQPSRPDTGYGYIQAGENIVDGVHRVLRFTEKPDLDTALNFLADGHYLWNAGIFIWSVQAILEAFAQHAPEIYAMLQAGEGQYNTPGEQAFINAVYPNTQNISVDFAIMEKAANVYTIPADFGWSDLGTWASLHAECTWDEQGNVVQGDSVIAIDLHNCLVRTRDEKLVVLRDLRDYIVVDEPDVLMIWPKSKEQEIKQLTTLVKSRFGTKYL